MRQAFICIFLISQFSVWSQPGTYREEILYTDLKLALEHPLKVKRLSLSGKKLKKVPKEIFEFKNLVELDLGKNRIEKLPDEWGTFTKLEDLNLSMNRLTELPASLTQLKRLRKLDLRKNKIWKLPNDLGELKKLEYLNLNGNPLFKLPDSIQYCNSLQYLDMRNTETSEGDKELIKSMLPGVNIFFSNGCNCGPNH
ncbi:MAG: leucine-rich repeat domain-containing protein [Candidatus Competibacteraceae bacterium]|nr:leucine-rich repeat domain-containing protein [Candidatus Competibacteraceae bacterium]